MCSYHDLCVTNTFFATKPQHRVSWCHPRFRHWHQLDLVITRRPSLNCVLTTRSYHSADCDTDHSLVGCKVRLQPKQIHRSKQKGHPRINTARTKMPDLCKRFADSTEEALRDCPTNSAEERWNHIRGAIYNSAMDTFGKRERQNPDWFEAGITKLEPAIADKRKALLNYKREPSEKTLAALRKARNDAQRLARRSANDYWLSLCQSIQLSADCGNIRAMYDNMKKAFGPSITKIAPLKTASGDTITDRGKQMERWAEHYQELYSRENVVSTATVEKCKALPLMEELDVPPSIDELGKAIDSLASGKAPGNDGIPPDVVKAGKSTVLHHHLHELLLHTVGKAFARVVLNRLQKLAERVYPEAQCGFRAERSTIDMVFSLRQLQEKCREQRRPLYIAFIDLTKAFVLNLFFYVVTIILNALLPTMNESLDALVEKVSACRGGPFFSRLRLRRCCRGNDAHVMRPSEVRTSGSLTVPGRDYTEEHELVRARPRGSHPLVLGHPSGEKESPAWFQMEYNPKSVTQESKGFSKMALTRFTRGHPRLNISPNALIMLYRHFYFHF
ncbi:uncharacterized protein LOC143034323 [Oratosquilla oratoria]|uniref:uncharacterized protein LOC143034323 n=1 Tax=Oratosquilla oratoria TaxID=337810 RepID=UPI003F760A22